MLSAEVVKKLNQCLELNPVSLKKRLFFPISIINTHKPGNTKSYSDCKCADCTALEQKNASSSELYARSWKWNFSCLTCSGSFVLALLFKSRFFKISQVQKLVLGKSPHILYTWYNPATYFLDGLVFLWLLLWQTVFVLCSSGYRYCSFHDPVTSLIHILFLILPQRPY